MRNIGYVVNVTGRLAEVVLGEHMECRRCGACLAPLDDTKRSIKAANEIGATVGEKVEVEIDPGYAVGAAFLVFILPLICVVTGGYMGSYLAGRAGISPLAGGIILGALSLGAYLLGLRQIDKAIAQRRIPRIVRQIEEAEPETQP